MVSSPFILHHGEDPDGIIAAALVGAYCEHQLKETPAAYFPLRYDNVNDLLPSIVEEAEKSHPCQIFVADINPTTSVLRDGLLYRLVDSVPLAHRDLSAMTWIDHHTGTEKLLADFQQHGIKVVHDANQCAALLTAKNFALNDDPYFHRLASIAQAHDYAKPGQFNELLLAGNELEKIIALANANGDEALLQRLITDLKDKHYFDDENVPLPFWQEHSSQYDSQKAVALEQLKESIILENVGDYRVLFALASPLLSQKPAPRYLKENYGDAADVQVCLFAAPYRNHIVQGKNDSSLDIVGFCQSMGGGGRNNSGGFTLQELITEENYAAQRKTIGERLECYLNDNLR